MHAVSHGIPYNYSESRRIEITFFAKQSDRIVHITGLRLIGEADGEKHTERERERGDGWKGTQKRRLADRLNERRRLIARDNDIGLIVDAEARPIYTAEHVTLIIHGLRLESDVDRVELFRHDFEIFRRRVGIFS